jgi:hypothetical protein
MVGKGERERLRLRKQALILESGVNRCALANEWRQVQAATAWVEEAKRWGQHARAWWPVAVPVLGAVAGWCFRRSAPAASRTGSLLKWAALAYSLWRQFGATKRPINAPAIENE